MHHQNLKDMQDKGKNGAKKCELRDESDLYRNKTKESQVWCKKDKYCKMQEIFIKDKYC